MIFLVQEEDGGADGEHGAARNRRSSRYSQIWRMTSRMRVALITYMFMFMSLGSRGVPAEGAGPRVGSRADVALSPQVDRTVVREQ